MQVRRILLRSAATLCAVSVVAAAAIAFAPVSGAHLVRGQIYGFFGAQDRAIAAYDEAIRFDPKVYFMVYMDRAEAYEAKGDASRALADYEYVLTRLPSAITPRQRIERIRQGKGRTETDGGVGIVPGGG
jgi:tetratricopeptide (TPR) repeat protein